MHLVIDDKRSPDHVDIIARNFTAGVLCLAFIGVTELSLDHDLGSEEEVSVVNSPLNETFLTNGLSVLRWLAKNRNKRPYKINLISMNPVGLQNMKHELASLGYSHVTDNTYILEE